MLDKEYEILLQMFERVLSDVGNNDLVKRCISFGCSGRYGWLLVMSGNVLPHGESSSVAILDQTFTLMKVNVADIVPLWEQLHSQKKGETSYYLHDNLYGPIQEVLWLRGIHPAWCRIKAFKRGSNSLVFNIHVSDKQTIRVNQPDLCVKVFLNSSYEVCVLNDIYEQCSVKRIEENRNPMRYVLSTIIMSGKINVKHFVDDKFLFENYLKNRQVAPLSGPLTLSSLNRDYWWNPNCTKVSPESSAVLMLYGEVYKGPINMRVKQVLTGCLDVVHSCGYLHTDIRSTNWLFFRGIPSSNEYAVDQGTLLLIDYDQCVKSMDTSEKHTPVETKPGQRRSKMLGVVLDEDNKSETQIINWSPAEDLGMLATMLIDCRREAATSVPGDLSQSF